MPAIPPPPPIPPLHAPAAAAAVSTPAPGSRYGFADAWLGETLAEWRASRPVRAKAPCTEAKALDVLVCRGVDADLGGGYAARDLSYAFVAGRLARISFRTSIDGFDHVTAVLKKASGAPERIVRDTLGPTGRPHVSMIWRNGRSTIVLSDPMADAVNLSVHFTLDALADKATQAG